MAKKNEQTTPAAKHIAAGEVILVKYNGDNKPCDKVLAILLNPITLEEGKNIGSFHLLYSFDTDKEEFLAQGSIYNVTAQISVASKKVKAWYFEQIMAMLDRIREKEEQQ